MGHPRDQLATCCIGGALAGPRLGEPPSHLFELLSQRGELSRRGQGHRRRGHAAPDPPGEILHGPLCGAHPVAQDEGHHRSDRSGCQQDHQEGIEVVADDEHRLGRDHCPNADSTHRGKGDGGHLCPDGPAAEGKQYQGTHHPREQGRSSRDPSQPEGVVGGHVECDRGRGGGHGSGHGDGERGPALHGSNL